jgi:hypothetical protein
LPYSIASPRERPDLVVVEWPMVEFANKMELANLNGCGSRVKLLAGSMILVSESFHNAGGFQMVINRSQLRAKVTFLKADQGGRQAPAISGVKPQFKLNHSSTSCFVWGETADQIFIPGVEYAVDLQLPLWDEHKNQISVGMAVQLMEGVASLPWVS